MSDSDIAKLIYRDNIRLKHASRKRLSDEISEKPALPSVRDRRNDHDLQIEDQHPLSKALVAYLLEAGRGLAFFYLYTQPVSCYLHLTCSYNVHTCSCADLSYIPSDYRELFGFAPICTRVSTWHMYS